jgi:hypothetical protein
MVWNVAGTLNKRWLTQASPTTRRITYKVGDLTPGREYVVLRNNIENEYTADSTGHITFSDTSVNASVTDFQVTP